MSSIDKTSKFSTPILLLVFNRPDLVSRQLKLLAALKPTDLYVAADGPRSTNHSDSKACAAVRSLFSTLPWECKLHTHFSDTNLGCKLAVSSSISWFFSMVEEGIILEDDCHPDLSFFPYCSSLLDMYRHSEEVMHISGFNPFGSVPINESYVFTQHPLCWGWATWRRAWDKYDVTLKNWSLEEKTLFLSRIMSNPRAIKFWYSIFDKMTAGLIDTWDYQWVYTLWKYHGLSILPQVNLVKNNGFDSRATHTKIPLSPHVLIESTSLSLPLSHPQLTINPEIDARLESMFSQTNVQKLLSFASRLLSFSP